MGRPVSSRKRSLFPVNRYASPRRALVVSVTQTLVNLALFVALLVAGAALDLWPTPPVPASETDAFRRGLVICFVISMAALLIYRWAVTRLIFKRYFDALLLIRAGYISQAIDTLTAQLDALRANPTPDRLRSVLLLDYAEYSFRETVLLTLGLLYAGTGDHSAARRAFREVLTLNEGNLVAQQVLENFPLAAQEAAAELAERVANRPQRGT
ncbi:MAG: hypothetical protein Kow00124_32320 [Anaerolineae bacterium]